MSVINWTAKVEYVCDKSESIVNVNFIKDIDDSLLPAFDVHRHYRAFWSPIEEDTPSLMLKRVPVIPNLTEEEEKKGLPGYYRACILGIQDEPSKFDTNRTRKSTQRGKNATSKNTSSKSKKGGSSTTHGSSSETSETKAVTELKKNRATRSNLPVLTNKENNFSKFDEKFSGDYGSDDSETDATLVPDHQVKVMRTSIKTLKSKLLEKCDENADLRKIIEEKDKELRTVRDLNTQLQKNILDTFPKIVSIRSLSSSSVSRSGSSSSVGSCLNEKTHFKHPSFSNSSRSRSTSVSSVSSEASIDFTASSKRKTPPASPERRDRKISSSDRSHQRNPVNDKTPTSTKTTHSNGSRDTSGYHTPSSSYKSVERGLFTPGTSEKAAAEDIATLLGDGDSTLSDETITNKSENMDVSLDDNEEALNILDAENSAGEKSETAQQVNFSPGFRVSEFALEKINKLPLAKASDGTFVRELAVAVFGIKVLYNASLAERKFKTQAEARRGLDKGALEEIRRRLQERVYSEYNGKPVPPEDFRRFQAAKVNRFIYEKIKQLRRNPSLISLGEPGGSAENIDSNHVETNNTTD